MNHQEAELRGTGNPLITIATVTYNADASLQATLDSVAGQDYARIEHLIVDGRSKDQTLGIIHRYVEDNTIAAIPHNIRLVCEPDEGLYDAMNKAIRLAAGDYIVFLNAGDRLHATTTISEIAAKADWIRGDYTNPAILYGETDLVDSDGKFVRHRRLQSPEKLTWQSFRAGMLVCHQSFYVRTDIAQENLYDLQYKFSADFDWCIRVLKMARKRRLQVVNTRLILTDYLTGDGLTVQNHRKSLMERLRVMVAHYGWLTTIAMHLWFVVRSIIKR